MSLIAWLVAAGVVVAPPATLVLEKIRTVDDPRIFHLNDAVDGDRGVPPSCTLADGTKLTLNHHKDATLEVDRAGTKKSIVVKNVAGLARATLACGATDDFYYANPRLGTLYAYSANRLFRGEEPIVWTHNASPFTNIDDANGIMTNASIATVVQTRGSLVLLEWFFRKEGVTGFWHELLDGGTGASLGKIGPSDLLVKTNDRDPWWVLFQGGGNETVNYVPQAIYRLKYESPHDGAIPAAATIVELRKQTPTGRLKAIATPSENPVINHMIALLSPTRTTVTPAIEFCPTVPRQRARYWLGTDYDDTLADVARNILMAFWAEQHEEANAGKNPLDAWFQSEIAPNEPMKTLLAHFNPQDDEWVAQYQQALFTMGRATFDRLFTQYGTATGAVVRIPQ